MKLDGDHPVPPDTTDANATSVDLVARVLAGQTELYAILVRRHQDEVYRVAASFLLDSMGTDNLVQQTFIKAFERLHQFRGASDFVGWVKTITRNLACDEIRRSKKEAKRLGRYREYLLSMATDGEAADDSERRMDEALEQCRQQLAPGAAQALTLRYDESMEIDAVARILGRTINATHQLLFRARTAIRRCLDGRLPQS